MMETETMLAKLDGKITQLSQNYLLLQEENKKLTNEITTLKAQNENQRIQVSQLEEELIKKEKEAEEIVKKVEEILGR
jgi:predicted  nucleic acid-binding Zn-ribbon protein